MLAQEQAQIDQIVNKPVLSDQVPLASDPSEEDGIGPMEDGFA